MSIYESHFLPRLTHLAMRQDLFVPYRRRVASGAAGRVLEIGIGSGLNLALYPDAVQTVIGVDPSPDLLRRAGQAARGSARTTEMIEGVAEHLPLEDRSVDCVVATWTLCSVSDPDAALSEIRRVLRPDGAFRFVEHGLAPDPSVRKWQRRLTPLWKRCAGNCHLNRSTPDLLARNGFHIERLETGYARGPKPFVFMSEGVARIR